VVIGDSVPVFENSEVEAVVATELVAAGDKNGRKKITAEAAVAARG